MARGRRHKDCPVGNKLYYLRLLIPQAVLAEPRQPHKQPLKPHNFYNLHVMLSESDVKP